MKKEDVKKKREVIVKYGMKDSEGSQLIPIEYDFISEVNDNLIVATKGSINGLRYTHGRIMCTVEENGTYGVVFEKKVKQKALDTEVHFYTEAGQLSVDDKILAAFVCKNANMLVLLDENYKWSIALIDYKNHTIYKYLYIDVDFIKIDYYMNTFIIKEGKEYCIVSFDKDNVAIKTTPWMPYNPTELYDKGTIVKKGDKYGFINHCGELVLQCIYDYISPKNAHIEAVKDDKHELYTYSGDFIADSNKYIWKSCCKLEDVDLIVLQHINGAYCLYSSKKQLLPCEYTSIELNQEFAVVNNSGKYVLMRYDKATEEMVVVYPANYPENYYRKMKFVYNKDGDYVDVETKYKKKRFKINLQEERENSF